jgi:hypothetical protein
VTRTSLGLCTLYLATALWLSWCALTTWGHVPTWVSILNIAASIVAVIAVVRDTELAEERRFVARLLAREARRAALEEPPADGAPLDDAETAAFGEIAAHWDDRSAA